MPGNDQPLRAPRILVPKRPLPRAPPTAAALMTSNVGPAHCAFCEQNHVSSSCTVVTDISARKEALRKAGRCYVCLRKGHGTLAVTADPREVFFFFFFSL